MKKRHFLVALLGLFATNSGIAQGILEEIIVTAQKREQSIQDVSVSITAIDGEQVKALGIEETLEMTRFIPNVQYQNLGAVDNIAIRGIGVGNTSDATEAPVGFYVDEVYKSTNAGQAIQLYDLERVEVLRGPQGTLFGRNTTGGLIHAITRKPSDERTFDLSAQGGSYSQKIFEMAVGGPISDSVRARLSTKWNEDKGWQKNQLNGERFAETDSIAVRGQLEFDLSEGATLLLKASYMDLNNGIFLPVVFNIFPDLFGPGTGPAGFSNPEGEAGLQNRDQTYSDFPASTPDDTEITDLSATLNWDLSDTLSLTSITAHSQTKRDFVEEAIGPTSNTLLALLGIGMGVPTLRQLDAKQFSQEIRLSGGTERSSWVLGAFYFDDDKDDGLSHTTPAAFETLNIYRLQTESWSFFGQNDFALTDRLFLVTGIRYTEDDLHLDLSGFATTNPNPLDVTQDLGTESVTWKVGLDFFATEDILYYGNVSTGYKSGGFNMTGVTLNEDTAPVGEEEVLTVELGWKTTLAGGKVRFNGAIFYSDYSDIQGIGFTQLPSGLLASQLISFGDADIKGAELELTLAPTDSFNLWLTAGWLDTKLKTGDPDNPQNGSPLSNAPELTLGATGTYYVYVGKNGTVSAQIAANWSDDILFNRGGTRGASVQEAFTLVDARLTWASEDLKYSLSIFGENLTDENYNVFGFNIEGFGQGVVPAKGRTWGFKFAYSL